MIRGKRLNLKWSEINMKALDLSKLILHFAQSNKAEGLSPKSISWYTEMLNDFVRYLNKTGKNSTLSELNVQSVREFILQEQMRGISPFTVHGKVRALRSFSSWLLTERYTEENVLSNVKPPKTPVKIIETLTPAEIDKLIETQNPLTGIGVRNLAILITLLDTGLRISELCNLRLRDAHIEEGYLKVSGKGNKERMVPIGALAQKVLWRYLFHFRPQPIGGDNDFLLLAFDGHQLQPNAVKLLLKRWGKKAGVPRLHAHLCRHSYATNFLMGKCGDVFTLKQILGHSSLEMVNKYVHLASTHTMIQNHPQSPVDQLNLKKLRRYKIDRSLKALETNKAGSRDNGDNSRYTLGTS